MRLSKIGVVIPVLSAIAVILIAGIALLGYHITVSDAPGYPVEEIRGMEIELIDINTASAEELERLPHITEDLAHDIISFRLSNGAFRRIEDIMNVSGIGAKTFAAIEQYITVQ